MPTAAAMNLTSLAGETPVAEAIDSINVIMTLAYGRSGSVLMQSLFDSHPNVVTLPFFGRMYSRLPPCIDNVERYADLFIGANTSLFDSSRGPFGEVGRGVTAKFGPGGDEDLWLDQAKFKDHLLALLQVVGAEPLTRRRFFICAHLAYAMCLRKISPGEIRYIFVHPHFDQVEDVSALVAEFPELYLLAMTRDPRQDWVSWRKNRPLWTAMDANKVPKISVFLSIYFWSKTTYDLMALTRVLKHGHVRVLDLERLHVGGERIMRSLCKWLGLEFRESLLMSTFNGQIWWGNATSQIKISGLNPKIRRDAWRSELAQDDLKLIEALLPGSLRHLGYELEQPPAEDAIQMAQRTFKYDNMFLLYYHCFLQEGKNPVSELYRLLKQTAARIFRTRKDAKAGSVRAAAPEYQTRAGAAAILVSDFRVMSRKVRAFFGVIVRCWRLVRLTGGAGLHRSLLEIERQQAELLASALPAGVLLK